MKIVENTKKMLSRINKMKKNSFNVEEKKSIENRFTIFKNYDDSFDFFKNNIKTFKTGDNFYFIYYSTLNQEGLINDRILHQYAIDRFHPNNINNKDFWIKCREVFPITSMSALICDSVDILNSKRNEFARDCGCIPLIENYINDKKNDDIMWYNDGEFKSEQKQEINILEIGFGYGNMFFQLKDKCNYYGIDYIIPENLKDYKNFIEIDKSGIPRHFINTEMMDIIFCMNTFQHMSQKDRFDYLEQGYSSLKKGGKFLFTCFLMTDDNKYDNNLWAAIDENNRGYVNFFNQLTEVDYLNELYYKTHDLGYQMKFLAKHLNFFSIVLEK